MAATPDETIEGPPLDVAGPLMSARAHAAKTVAAWLIAIAFVTVAAVPGHRLFGWPSVDGVVHGEVISSSTRDDEITVSFAAPSGSRVISWRRYLEHSEWRVGEALSAPIDENGGLHHTRIFGVAGSAIVIVALLLLSSAAFSVRRLWGIQLAWWDLRRGNDRARLGWVALIRDPTPRTVRPLLSVWWTDPTRGERLPRPDGVYRADEETARHLKTSVADLEIRRAWIDRGRFRRSKPRWVGTEGGVIVPHRRSFLGRFFVRLLTRKSQVPEPIDLHHRQPDPSHPSDSPQVPGAKQHRLAPMIAWRLGAAALCVGVGIVIGDGGVPTISVAGPLETDSSMIENVHSRPGARVERDRAPEYLASLAASHGLEVARRTTWPENTTEFLEWRFPTPEDARSFAIAEMGMWALAGRVEQSGIVTPSGDQSDLVTMQILIADRTVLRPMIFASDEMLDELATLIADLD